MWINDKVWTNAASFVFSLSRVCSWVLAPQELQGLVPRCLPLEFSNIIDCKQSCAIVMLKDSVDRLALSWLKQLSKFHIIHIDKVFVVMSTTKLPDIEPPPDDVIARESRYLWEKLESVIAGRPIRESRLECSLSTALAGDPYCLIINACWAGNVGETLLAASAREIMQQARPDLKCIVAGPDVDRTLVAGASLVIVGPGGMLYDLVDHAELTIDFQNIANYFRFGFVAKEYKKPFCLIGISNQLRLISHTTLEFVSQALTDSLFANCRDLVTAASFTGQLEFQRPLVVTPDVCVVFSEEIRSLARKPTSTRTLAICGSFGVRTLCDETLKRDAGRVRIVLQALEDFLWFRRMESRLRKEFPDLEVADVRTAGIRPFFEAIATADAVISSRFHAMMIAIIAGIDTLVAGISGDKRHRVCSSLQEKTWIWFVDLRSENEEGARSSIATLVKSGKRKPDRGVFASSDLDPLRGLIEYASKASPACAQALPVSGGHTAQLAHVSLPHLNT